MNLDGRLGTDDVMGFTRSTNRWDGELIGLGGR